MKIVIAILIFQIITSRLFEVKKTKDRYRKLAEKVARKLFLEDLNLTTGNSQLNELDTTHTNYYQLEGHNRRSAQMRQIGTWFGELDNVIDNYRDELSGKLDQFSMRLQQPKYPTQGFLAGTVNTRAVPANGANGANVANGANGANGASLAQYRRIK